ncbi:MAG: respiratory chain complex I subunit 1 family protein [Anaerovoracaceae bacterium]|jgi:ech hydrogenase subunit B
MKMMIIAVIAYLVLAPIVGGFLAGIDRKLSARMQSRVGPPIRQPFYDVFKLTEKEDITVNNVQDFYVLCFLIFIIVTGCLFFAGQSLLLVFFTLTTASAFLIIAAYSSNSPYAEAGAQRELLQVMAYEPMVLLVAVGLYMATGTFQVSQIMTQTSMPFWSTWGILIGYVFILTIKMRKSPFDLSMSEHAHQELVGGLKTEWSGKTLAMVEVAHWYENVMLLGLVFLFFQNGTVQGVIIGIVEAIIAYLFEIVVDNSFARMKWQVAINCSWIVALVFGGVNLFVLMLM